MNFPLCWSAVFAAISSPPQQGTSMRTTVTLLMSFSRIISVAVIDVVQLGAAHQRDVPLDELLVEGGVGVGGAVGGDEEPCAVKIGRVHRHQLDLHRPLGKAAHLLGLRRFHGGRVLALNIPGLAARAAARQGHALVPHFPLLIFHDGLLVISRRLPLHKGDGPGGAGGQAVTQAVAVIVPHEPCLAVHHGDGALVTGGGAGTAAVAFILIDFNDPSFHCNASLLLWLDYTKIKSASRLNFQQERTFMKEFFPVLHAAPLFSGISDEELAVMLSCLGARIGTFPKGARLLRAGDTVEEVGLVLAGSALVVQEDIWGNRSILSKIGPGQTFAEVFACAPGSVLNVSVEAESAVTVMFLHIRRVLSVCPSACSHHSRIIRNLLGELAEKNLRLNEKLTHMGQRTTRAKLMSYFSAEAQRRGGYEFDIPFSRQQLADYLGVERSGLSLELGKMRDEGLLDFHKSHFLLKAPETDGLPPSAR